MTFITQRRGATTLAFALFVLFDARAHAQVEDPAAEAEAAIARGVALRQAGNDDEALAAFRQADQRSPSPRAKAQIALAEQALGQWVAAERDLRAALAAVDDPWIQRNREALAAAMNQIASRLGSLEVRTSAPGAELFVNEERVASLPLAEPIRVAVGTVSLEVRAPGHLPQRRSIDVTSGARMREVFTLAPARSIEPESSAANGARAASEASASSPRAPRAANEPAGAPIGPIVTLGLGGASMILSGVFGALRGGAYAACPYEASTNTLLCDGPAATARAQAGVGYTTGVNVTLVTGAVLLVGGGAWLAVSMLQRGGERPATRASVTWAPAPQFNGAAIVATGRF
jgi:hypothetical protein